ncbi:uncharacterized, partial [Tachysurus ichikawai]
LNISRHLNTSQRVNTSTSLDTSTLLNVSIPNISQHLNTSQRVNTSTSLNTSTLLNTSKSLNLKLNLTHLIVSGSSFLISLFINALVGLISDLRSPLHSHTQFLSPPGLKSTFCISGSERKWFISYHY